MVAVESQGKSDFVRDVLAKNPTANADAVNAAWKEAGQEGRVSGSLVQKMRAKLNLTGNLRSRKGTGGGGAKTKSAAVRKGGGATQARGRSRAENGTHAVSAPVSQPKASGGNGRVVEELERDLDRLIYRLIEMDGMAEVEEAVRRARRLLIRSQQA